MDFIVIKRFCDILCKSYAIDLAKMAQLIPVIGAAVGAVVNYRLVQQLGVTAMNCYRMRMLEAK